MTGLRLLVGLLLITAPLTAVASKQCTDTFYFTHQADLSAALEQRGIPHELDEDGDYELSIDGHVTYLIISSTATRQLSFIAGEDDMTFPTDVSMPLLKAVLLALLRVDGYVHAAAGRGEGAAEPEKAQR